MIQHYQKLHSDSDLVRTKEDLLLYIPDELENELVIDVKNNFNAGIEACGQFSNNSDTIGKVSLAMEYRRVMCKNNGHNRCSLEKQAHCELQPTIEECKFLLSKIYYFAKDQKFSEIQHYHAQDHQEPYYQDQIEQMVVSPETYYYQEQRTKKVGSQMINFQRNSKIFFMRNKYKYKQKLKVIW